MADVDIAIIGGGAVGYAVAYELSRRSSAEIVVLEALPKSRRENQSTRNAGVIHAGISHDQRRFPKIGRFCSEGNRLMYDFCAEHGVPHKRVGKLVVATNALEQEYLDDVMAIAEANEVQGIRRIGTAEVRSLEPNVFATEALHVPSSGVVDAAGYLDALTRLSGCHQLFERNVVALESVADGISVTTQGPAGTESFVAARIINAAGVYSSMVAAMLNGEDDFDVLPIRGEAAKFYMSRRDGLSMTGMNVYPAPHGIYQASGERANVPIGEYRELLAKGEVWHFVGVHLTPTLEGDGSIANTVTVSPYLQMGFELEDHATGLRPASDFCSRVRDFFPNLRPEDLELHQSGTVAMLTGSRDWIIGPDRLEPRLVNAVGVGSPGLTSSLAIAKYMAEEFDLGL